MGYARSAFGYPQNVLRRFSADTPHRTVRAVFPHTALRVGLVSSVSLPFAPRLRFTLIPMDAPPYGRAVSDAPPHSGLSPIAVFRHYCSRHLICIVPFTRRGPLLHGHCPLPRYYGLVRLLASLSRTRLRALRVRLAPKVPFELRSSVHSREVSRVPLLNFPNTRSSYVPPRFNYPSRFDSLLLAS